MENLFMVGASKPPVVHRGALFPVTLEMVKEAAGLTRFVEIAYAAGGASVTAATVIGYGPWWYAVMYDLSLIYDSAETAVMYMIGPSLVHEAVQNRDLMIELALQDTRFGRTREMVTTLDGNLVPKGS